MHRHAQTENIRPHIRMTGIVFRRGIAPGSQHCGIRKVFILVFSCDAEVDDLNDAVFAFRLQHQVRRLHIAVDDRVRLLGMQVVQRIADLHCPMNDIIFRLRTMLFQDLVQGFAFDVVHDDVNRLTIINDIDNSRERRVIKAFN